MDRRNFLRVTGAAGLATMWGSSLACAHSTAAAAGASAVRPGTFSISNVGLQLYTVRDAMAKDVDGTLAAVAAAGYKLAETAGLYGKSASELRAAFDAHGIRTVSGHYPLADLEASPETVFTTAKTLGQEYVTVPWLDPSLRTAGRTAAAWLRVNGNWAPHAGRCPDGRPGVIASVQYGCVAPGPIAHGQLVKTGHERLPVQRKLS